MSLTGQSTASMLADELKKMINNGTLSDGERLVERDLAAQFSVSRIPMREAIQQLEREGMVEIFRNRGAVVKTLGGEDIDEIYQLRALLEGEAILQSVPNLDADTLVRAQLTHQLLGQASGFEKQGLYNREFHDLLYQGCKNQRLLSMIDDLRNQIERYEYLQQRLLSDTPKFQDDHNAILTACQQGDAQRARAETVRHITAAGETLKIFVSSQIRQK
ncbi:GntR family transcriptional regulator [Phytobacter sp. V91]|uniref:GntR family transcriptional regulator n=1 Tax=Phytobacter sp. V91 TaxID=3369425 RepID=UPI003F63A058